MRKRHTRYLAHCGANFAATARYRVLSAHLQGTPWETPHWAGLILYDAECSQCKKPLMGFIYYDHLGHEAGGVDGCLRAITKARHRSTMNELIVSGLAYPMGRRLAESVLASRKEIPYDLIKVRVQ